MLARRKAYKGIAMEGPIASWYARITAGGARNFTGTAAAIAARLPAGARVLEVAPGPGYLALELARAGFRVTGLDISHSFVRIATANARRAGLAIDFRQGNAAQMPFAERAFDFVVCVAAFKNFTDPVGALDEVHRVLTPGGSASIQDLRKDAPPAAVDAEVTGMGLSRLNTALTKLTFRFMLLRNAYTRPALQEMVAASAFRTGQIIDQGIAFDLRLARPPLTPQ
jgi:ubiquinone/menaquinone biosynthesis C-methylase UbiE